MSDRYVLYSDQEMIEGQFGVSTERADYFEPNYNIDPGTRVPAIFARDNERRIRLFQWGMIPEEAGQEKDGIRNINVPVEKIGKEDPVREAFERRRCIVPANGFYKWKTSEKRSTPFYIRLLSNEVMGLAGIYSVWQSKSGRDVYSFSFLTTEANALIQPVDARMPVILRPQSYDIWLSDRKVDSDTLASLLKPYLLTEMVVNRVSEEVNDPDNDRPELIQPIPK